MPLKSEGLNWLSSKSPVFVKCKVIWLFLPLLYGNRGFKPHTAVVIFNLYHVRIGDLNPPLLLGCQPDLTSWLMV
jgi:hypothetical protein